MANILKKENLTALTKIISIFILNYVIIYSPVNSPESRKMTKYTIRSGGEDRVRVSSSAPLSYYSNYIKISSGNTIATIK